MMFVPHTVYMTSSRARCAVARGERARDRRGRGAIGAWIVRIVNQE